MDKRKWIWWISIAGGAGCLSALGWLGLAHVEATMDVGKLLADEARSRYGRELTVDRIEWGLFPTPSIKMVGVALSNPEARGRPPMAQIDSAQIWVSVAALARGEARLTKARVEGLTLRVGVDAGGVDDWNFEEKSRGSGASQGRAIPSGRSDGIAQGALSDFSEVEIGRAAIEKVARMGAPARRYEVESATAKMADGSVGIHAKALVGGGALFIDGSVAVDKGGLALRAEIKGKDWGAVASGSGSGLEEFRLSLRAKGTDAGAVERMWRPDAAMAGPFAASAIVERTGAQLRVEKFDARWGGWAAGGAASLDFSQARPAANVSLRFTREREDLGHVPAPFDGVMAERGDGATRDGGSAAMPWGALGLADVIGDVEIDEVSIGAGTLSNVKAKIDLRSGALRIDPFQAGFGGGLVSGRIVANARDRSVGFSGSLGGTSAEAMASALGAGKALTGGAMSIQADLRSSGSGKEEMMSNLAGSASVDVGKSRVASRGASQAGLAMGALLSALGARDGILELDCVGARMTISKGVASGSPMVGVEGPAVSALASGVVGFGREVVDLGFDVRGKGRLDVSSLSTLASAARVSGPWSGPRVGVDPARAGAGLAAIGSAIRMGPSGLADMLSTKTARGGNACAVALGRVEGEAAAAESLGAPPLGAANPLAALRRLLGR